MDPIYLDHAASTPVRPEVREAMAPFLSEDFGNPSSIHRWGRRSRAALEEARARMAAALDVDRREVVFVRGGTESDNLALLGRADAARAAGREPFVVVSAIEHAAVLEASAAVEAAGGRRELLPVGTDGLLDLDALDRVLAERPDCVSVIWVNNEIGVVQPMAEIADRCRAAGVVLHTDAVQAAGKIPVRPAGIGVDLLSLTGHKIQGPKGTGALVVRDGTELAPRIHGGTQEDGLRAGTQDVAGAVGLATALELAVAEQPDAAVRLTQLRDRLHARLEAGIPGLQLHGAGAPRAPHILNVLVPEVDAELLLASLDLEGLAVSGGSACSSGSTEASHVIRALIGPEAPASNLRFSFGRGTTGDEVDRAAAIVLGVVDRLRAHPVPA